MNEQALIQPIELTTGQVAKLLRVNRTTVLRWIGNGRFGQTRRKGFGETSPTMIEYSAVERVASEIGIDLIRENDENGA